MANNRPLMIGLAVLFAAVLLYNVLLFTGFTGGGGMQVQPTTPPLNFSPEVVAVLPSSPSLRLTAVVMDSSGRKVAVINDEIVTEGDIIEGMQVIEVMDDAVMFRYGGRRHLVRMTDAGINLSVGHGASPGKLR